MTGADDGRTHARQAELGAAIGAALTSRDPLSQQLQRCMEALVSHLDAAFARIWTLDETDPSILVLRASAGLYTHLDGAHARVPVGSWKIGRIAAERHPHLTNAVVGDPDVHDQAWARREGMVAFAGYPLLVGDRVPGVLALFARRPLEDAALAVLGSVADAIAVAVDRAQIETERAALLGRERVARERAETAQARYRGLFEGVADAILVADDERRYVDANVAATTLLGYSHAEFLGLRVEDIVAVGPARTEAEYARYLADGCWQGELDLRRQDGTTITVEARATVVALPAGPVNIAAVRDVSERRAAERLQREFLESVSHDLKNPLTTVQAQAQLLRRRIARGEDVPPEQLDRALAVIEAGSRRMVAQLEELQDVAKLRAGQALELQYEPTDLGALVRAAVGDARAATERHGIHVETPPTLVGTWDAPRLRRALDNLLGNAVKYSPSGGTVTVRVAEEMRPGGTWAVVSVSDPGIGIPAADLPYIFEAGRRGGNVTGRIGGTGIGLAGVRRIVEQHGGMVRAMSDEGQGSTFTVALPLECPKAPA